MTNSDLKTVAGFGEEWNHFRQDHEDLQLAFNQYFDIFPWQELPPDSCGFDMGCGSGRWASKVAPRVRRLTCIDASDRAISIAKRNLAEHNNIDYVCASLEETNLPPASQDFGYCLGVLHHIPDTQWGIKECAHLLKRGAPFLAYIYYRFDNKPHWYRFVWMISDKIRFVICRFPFSLRVLTTNLIAILVYLPLARTAWLLEKIGFNIENFLLADYRNKSFYFIRTDSLDRFGTSLEKRFTLDEIDSMFKEAGLKIRRVSSSTPYWVVLATKT